MNECSISRACGRLSSQFFPLLSHMSWMEETLYPRRQSSLQRTNMQFPTFYTTLRFLKERTFKYDCIVERIGIMWMNNKSCTALLFDIFLRNVVKQNLETAFRLRRSCSKSCGYTAEPPVAPRDQSKWLSVRQLLLLLRCFDLLLTSTKSPRISSDYFPQLLTF